jgi:signal transduction histidine kinase
MCGKVFHLACSISFPKNSSALSRFNNSLGRNLKTNNETTTEAAKPFLAKERGYTDESLTTERGKTDDSLFALRRKAEQETDAIVKSDRKEADSTRDRRRVDHDRNTKVDSGLIKQRAADDKIVLNERAKSDCAIQNERIEKDRALSEFLHREREETDDNLSHEREQTDVAVLNSSKLLTDEVGLHSRTKAELTTRDELLAIVSHDLKNPIGSVLSCAEMLLDDPEFSEIKPDLRNWIQLIKRNAETSLRLISDILDMERIAEGKLELRPTQQSLSKLVRESIEPFAHRASAKRVLLRALPSGTDVLSYFDRERLSQVLSNLIGNAIKFTPEGGSITLRVQQTPHQTEVQVRDTGEGIPDEEKQRIFHRYAQIGKKDHRGLGLGLYISKMLIESHGGQLWVTSAPDRGSIFHFSLPNSNSSP